MAFSDTSFRIESSDMNLDKLLQDFYSVPDFQREYVWEREHVHQLLQDVTDALTESDGTISEDNEYFIGSIVVSTGHGSVFQLIDGQQRLTTCYLIVCSVRDAIQEAGHQPPDWLRQLIAASSKKNLLGENELRYRLALQYEDSDGVLAKIADENGPDNDDIPRSTKSVQYLMSAYDAIREFFRINFDDDPKRILTFCAVMTSNVKLIRIATPDLSQALKVFETINDRGVGLNAMDLLKNLLFINLKPTHYPVLKDRWKQLIDTLERSAEKPLRFLRYFVLANYTTDSSKPLREDQIYGWLSSNHQQTGIDASALEFVDLLLENANAYLKYTRSEDPEGRPNRFLENLATFNGRSRQHYVLLLAGRHLPEDAFSCLSEQLENLLFCYTITRTPAKYLEANLTRWAVHLRDARTREDVKAFVERFIVPELQAKSGDFDYALLNLDQHRIQQYRMRYILAKLTQYINLLAWSNAEDRNLRKFLDKSVHVEHILSWTPDTTLPNSFDKPDLYDEYKVKLGNLTLLEQAINTSISNGQYETKLDGYANSQYLITKAIFELPQVGVNTKYDQAVKLLPQFERWDSTAIDRRQEALKDLAREVWRIPSTKSSVGTDS